jgi:hypothetical protein
MTTSFDELAQRGRGMTRAQRGVVKSRTSQADQPAMAGPPDPVVPTAYDIPTSESLAGAASSKGGRLQPPSVPAGESTTAIGLRLRKTIDNGLADRIHALRVELDRRVTKTELLEMLAWEAGIVTVNELAERVDRYRKRAPRRE